MNSTLTCNSSATTMAPELAISVILVTTAIIAYGPKVLSSQQVTGGGGYVVLELSAVPRRRAARVYRGFCPICQQEIQLLFCFRFRGGNQVAFMGPSLLQRSSAYVPYALWPFSRDTPQKALESDLLPHSQLQCEWPMPTSARTAVLSLQSATIGAGPQPDQASWMTSRRYR